MNISQIDISFTVHRSDGRCLMYRRRGERYNDACVVERDRFGGGSVSVGAVSRMGLSHPWSWLTVT